MAIERNERRKQGPGAWIGALIFLLISTEGAILPLLILIGIGYGIFWLVKNASKSATGQNTAAHRNSNTRYTTRQDKFDDCPQPLFCFHKDKGEHHVRKGKEIDPWDRPDIDISKYQRK